MQQLQQQAPGSPLQQMTPLTATLPAMNAQNCQSMLAPFSVSGGNDFYNQSLNALVSPEGVTVRVIWRTLRNREAGTDQIADWHLVGNQQMIGYLNDTTDLH